MKRNRRTDETHMLSKSEHLSDRAFSRLPTHNEDLFTTGEDLISQLLSQVPAFDEKAVIESTVVQSRGNDIIVDLGRKNYGKLLKAELQRGMEAFEVSPGDRLEVVAKTLDAEPRHDYVNVSWKAAQKQKMWPELRQKILDKGVVEGAILKEIHGGYIVNIDGASAFLPRSHVGFTPPDKEVMDELKSGMQQFMILSMDDRNKNLVVSIREVKNLDRAKNKREAMRGVEAGQKFIGVIKSIKEYGCFVSFKVKKPDTEDEYMTVDGLVHLHDLCYQRVKRASEVPGIEVGAEKEVVVLKVDCDDVKGPKISLGIRQLHKSPWQGLEKTHFVGAKMQGKISSVADYGVFVRVPGSEQGEFVDGLVHLTEISWARGHFHNLEVGQGVEVVVIASDIPNCRISLSIKRAVENPWRAFESEFKVGQVIDVKVKKALACGLFVDLGTSSKDPSKYSEIEGLVRPGNISWTNLELKRIQELYRPDKMIKAKILSIDVEEGKVGLGIKQVEHDPYEDFLKKLEKGSIIPKATIAGAWLDRVEVEVQECSTIISIMGSDLPESFQQDRERFGRNMRGARVDLKVLEVDSEKRHLRATVVDGQQ